MCEKYISIKTKCILCVFVCARFIAIHQTYMEQLLKQRLRDAPGFDDEGAEEEKEECICFDMDFAENYEVVHKVEIQADHWKHQQVTLYIVIAHFKNEGMWTSEAHIFVSGDHSHDTYFVQRAMAGSSSICMCLCVVVSEICSILLS